MMTAMMMIGMTETKTAMQRTLHSREKGQPR